MSTRRRRPMPLPTVYTVDLDQRTVDLLSHGICPESLAQFAFDLVAWRREAIRATTPEKKRTPSKKKMPRRLKSMRAGTR